MEILMIKAFIPSSVLTLCAAALLSACVIAPSVGDRQGDTPPRLVTDPDNKPNLMWDNPKAFGPVPAEQAARGEQSCSSLNTKDMQFKATGYHALAQGVDGKSFVGGGFFCVRK
jgi:hypothetical protein